MGPGGGRYALFDTLFDLQPRGAQQTLLRGMLNFVEVLAGGDVSSGVPMIAHAVVEQHTDVVKAIKFGLYDTLVLGFMHAYDGDAAAPVAAFDEDMHRAAYALMKLAVITMADYVA